MRSLNARGDLYTSAAGSRRTAVTEHSFDDLGTIAVTLVDGDTVLWESNAIMCYLAGKTEGLQERIAKVWAELRALESTRVMVDQGAVSLFGLDGEGRYRQGLQLDLELDALLESVPLRTPSPESPP